MALARRTSCHSLPCGRPGVLLRSPSCGTLIAVRADHEEWPAQSTGPALKVIQEGEREFWVDRSRYPLGPGRYLLLPHGARSQSGRTSARVSMLPVWFSEKTMRSVACTLGPTREEARIDHEASSSEIDVTLLPRSAILERAVGRLWRFAGSVEASFAPRSDLLRLESLLLRTFAAVWRASRRAARRLERLDAVRPSTRREIARRLGIAEDLLRARFRTPVSLSEMSRAAAMSPYHLLRRFEEFFGVTPHRFLTRLRLSHARRLLGGGRRSVKQVALECGYQSVPSFIHLCVREWGLTPTELSRS